jgi:hypothetical protein
VQSNILTPRSRSPGSKTVHGTVDPFPATVQHVGVNHRRLHISVSEEFLNCANIIAIFQQVRGERMPKHVTVGRPSQPDCARGLFDGSLEHRFVQMMPPVFTGPGVQADL